MERVTWKHALPYAQQPVGTITIYPLNWEDEVAGEGFLEVDAFTLDLEGQEGLDDAKIGGRDI